MITSPHRPRPLSLALLALAATVLLAPVDARAQTGATDPRWQAWQGCWQPMADPVTGVNSAPFSQVCLVPSAKPAAVDLVAIADGREASRETLDVTGARRASEQDGCTGWEQAVWSDDGRRLYRTSEHQCPGGTSRATSGLFALTPTGDWLDVMSVTSGGNTGIRVMHYRPSFLVSSALPPDAQSALQQRLGAANMARTAASAPATTQTIVDVTSHTSAGVAEAWLGELGQKFEISANDLKALAGAGVPGRVTDLVVALAYPQTFGLKRGPTPVVSAAATASAASGAGPRSLTDCRFVPGYASSTCGLYNPFLFGYGYYGYSAYNGYGVGPYGYRPYGTWYSGADPIVIVVGPQDGGGNSTGTTHGQVSRTRGYVEGRSDTPAPPAPSSAQPASAPAPSSSDGGGGGGSSAPASSGGGERTAHPR